MILYLSGKLSTREEVRRGEDKKSVSFVCMSMQAGKLLEHSVKTVVGGQDYQNTVYLMQLRCLTNRVPGTPFVD